MADGSTDRVRTRIRPAARTLTLIAAFWALAALPAAASEVVDLRIGAHADFTRVVFELDRPTGYRIERASPEPGVQELVVSLDATSIPRKVHSSPKSLIGLVRITPEGEGSVARIQLVEGGLNLKEMILANPPRIVLDVMSPAKTAAASKPAPKPAPKPAAKPVAKAPAPEATKPAPKPVQTARAETPEPSATAASPDRTGAQPATSADALAAAETTGADEATVPGKPVDAAAPDAKAPGDDLAAAPVGEPSEGGVATMGLDMAKEADKPPPPPAAERVAKRTLPAAPARVADADAGMGMGTIGTAIVGLVVLGGGFVLWRRRRGDAGDDGDDEGIELGGGADDNPFAGIGASESSPLSTTGRAAGASTTGRAAGASTPGRAAGASTTGRAAGAASEFDLGGIEEEEKEAAPVDAPLAARSDRAFSEADALIQTMAQDGGGVAAGLASDDEKEGDEEIMRIIREFERRIASLESRLDEVVDARERLERQVAAQTEELRVQRAAIARTQRAVRNLNRSDEEGPTEPAIREPQ